MYCYVGEETPANAGAIGHGTTMRELRRLPWPLHVFRNRGLEWFTSYLNTWIPAKKSTQFVLKGDYCSHFGSVTVAFTVSILCDLLLLLLLPPPPLLLLLLLLL